MSTREELFEKLLVYLQTEQTPPDYLGQPPDQPESFDPYQVVAEWVALRHEVKQQGKQLQSAQEALRQALNLLQAEKEQLQLRLEESQRQVSTECTSELAMQRKQFEQEQEGFLKHLLGVMDALDHACAHWQEEKESADTATASHTGWQPTIWGRLANWFARVCRDQSVEHSQNQTSTLAEVLESNRQGAELIRRSLLDALRQQQVVPLTAQGHPFDPQRMYAVGRHETTELPDNTVYQEVVRGYLWKDQILREAQVIVAAKKGDIA
jgi:molecular chaperone GrpE